MAVTLDSPANENPRTHSIPRIKDLATGISHTALLVRWRWRLVRNGRTRVFMVVGAIFAFGMLFAASSIGEMIRLIAERNSRETAAGDFAIGYLVAFSRGDFGGIAAFALGTAIAASIFGPLTGSSNLTLAPTEDLSTLHLHRLHRYFDSLILQAFSTIGALQLLSLTTVASLLTMDGNNRAYALLLTWSIWIALVFLTTVEGWLIEIVYRKYRMRLRFVLGGILATLIGVAIWFDPNNGSTFFGVGVYYSNALQGELLSIPTWIPFAGVLAIVTILGFIGASLCNFALNKPSAPTRGSTSVSGKRLPRIRISKNPTVALYQVILTQMSRTQAVARPIAVVFLLSIPAVWFTKGSFEVMTTLVLATPLAIVLGWTANALGVLGPGMTWLLSLPNTVRNIPGAIAGTSLGVIFIIFIAAWIPVTIIGRTTWLQVVSTGSAITITSFMMTRSGLSKAIHRPFLARLGSTRGDSIIPPLTAVTYTARFALFSGMLGIIVMSFDNVPLQWAVAGVFVSWSGFRYLMVKRSWANRSRQAQVTAVVATG